MDKSGAIILIKSKKKAAEFPKEFSGPN